MTIVLVGARILTPDLEIPQGSVAIEGGRIVAVGADLEPPPGATVQDLTHLTLVPGFIDLHVHGGGGFSLASGDPEEIREYARWVAARGVTAFLATVAADSHDEALACLRAVAAAVGPIRGGASLLGIHLEGPFVNAKRRGALPQGWLRPPETEVLEAYLEAAGGHFRLLTLAPELAGAPAVMAAARQRGLILAIGHTDATYEEAKAAIEAGARYATHVFNAMRPFHHRDPGPVAAILESPQVVAEVIADGVHVHPAALRLLLQAKGSSRVVLASDGAPLAGLEQGSFPLGDAEARLEGGRVLLSDGTLAGSAITLDRALSNLVHWGLASLAEAVGMAATNPAHLLGRGQRKGRIAPGYDADLVALDEELAVAMTWVAGEMLPFRR